VVTLLQLVALVNQRKGRILQVAEAALPERQFRAFRRCVLDELGRDGLERDLERALAEGKRDGNGPGRPIHAGKEVPYG
jgi:hypothetical protein